MNISWEKYQACHYQSDDVNLWQYFYCKQVWWHNILRRYSISETFPTDYRKVSNHKWSAQLAVAIQFEIMIKDVIFAIVVLLSAHTDVKMLTFEEIFCEQLIITAIFCDWKCPNQRHFLKPCAIFRMRNISSEIIKCLLWTKLHNDLFYIKLIKLLRKQRRKPSTWNNENQRLHWLKVYFWRNLHQFFVSSPLPPSES